MNSNYHNTTNGSRALSEPCVMWALSTGAWCAVVAHTKKEASLVAAAISFYETRMICARGTQCRNTHAVGRENLRPSHWIFIPRPDGSQSGLRTSRNSARASILLSLITTQCWLYCITVVNARRLADSDLKVRWILWKMERCTGTPWYRLQRKVRTKWANRDLPVKLNLSWMKPAQNSLVSSRGTDR